MLVVTQLVKTYVAFMEPGCSLPCSQMPAVAAYPEPVESSPQTFPSGVVCFSYMCTGHLEAIHALPNIIFHILHSAVMLLIFITMLLISPIFSLVNQDHVLLLFSLFF
jgi:hypothetical protein